VTALTNEEVIGRAKDWAHLHRNPKTRPRMDAILDGLSEADQRRVYLCGQRIVGGLPIKVVPSTATTEGVKPNGDTKRRKTKGQGKTDNKTA